MSGKNLKIDGKVCPNATVIKALDTDQNKLVEFVDTSDANATSSDIITGKTAYVDGKKVIGEATAGIDTSDATAIAADIRLGKTAYAKDAKLTGTIEDYDGTFVKKVTWKASVSNLGAEDPNTVVFNTPADSVPKPWSEVEFNGDVFIKFPKMYRKIVTVTDNQITAFEIANKKIDNDYKLYPCFIDESGNELDYILVGKYMSKSEDVCNSVAAGEPILQFISNGREKARARGTGYQLMDWRIQRLWQDLLICAMKTVNTNNGEGIKDSDKIITDKLGICWESDEFGSFLAQAIDGIETSGMGYEWGYSNSPSKYVNGPIYPGTDGYRWASYSAPTVREGVIKTLGYMSSDGDEFFNYPAGRVAEDANYKTYYCDGFIIVDDTLDYAFLAISAYDTTSYSGAFNAIAAGWDDEIVAMRLCYRPISS